MEKIVYIYGSARNSATRALRRGSLPREMQVRLGPWTVRPSRRFAVDFTALAKFEREVLEKVTNGVVQIQNGAQAPYTLDELKEAFAMLRAEPGAETPMTMPYAELMELMRSESPSQAVWDAFVERSLSGPDTVGLPDIESRVRALTEYAQKNAERLNVSKSLQLIHAASKAARDERARLQAEADAQAAADQAAREAEERAERERAAAHEARLAADVKPTVEETPSTGAVASDPEQMDFALKGEETKADEAPAETVTEGAVASDPVVEEKATETAPAAEETPAVDDKAAARAAREAQLPEGWRTFTNAKLAELLTGLEVALPERQNKASFVAAVEAWLGGN